MCRPPGYAGPAYKQGSRGSLMSEDNQSRLAVFANGLGFGLAAFYDSPWLKGIGAVLVCGSVWWLRRLAFHA